MLWTNIFMYQKLSEEFIKKYKDKNFFSWLKISRFQRHLSKEFYFEFYDKIYWKELDSKKMLYKGYFDNAPREVKLHIALNHRELIKYL